MPELLFLLFILAVATAGGLWQRARNGRMRTPRPVAVDHPSPGPVDVAVAEDSKPADTAAYLSGDVIREQFGVPPGERATLVQFSSAFCQPCRATRLLLSDVADTVPGVVHVEVDSESHMDLVRRYKVMRTPTVLVLDASGRVVRRASGLPRRSDVLAALADAV